MFNDHLVRRVRLDLWDFLREDTGSKRNLGEGLVD